MADTFTSTLRLQQPTVGADAATWGGYLNTDLVLIDNAINGVSNINIAGLASYTLTVANGAVDQARNLVYNFTGALSADCTVTLPANAKFGYAVNSTTGGHTVILTTGLGGTNLTLPTAAYYTFFTCDGTNVLAPSVGFGYTNVTKDLLVSGNLNVTGLTGIGGLTAGATTVSSLNSTGTVVIGTSSYTTNGDGFIPYLNANRSAIINQAVTNTSSPVFTDVGITGVGFLKSFINQGVLTTSSPTFANLGITGLGFISNLLNQALLTSSSPTFSGVTAGSILTNSLSSNGTLNVSGNVGMSAALTVNGAIGASTLSVSGGFSGSTSGWQLSPAGTGSFSGGFNLSISANLGVLGNTFIAASDARVKENIEPIHPREGLRFVREIGAKTYLHDGALSAGFLAQDVIRKGFQRMVIISNSDDPRVAEGDDISPAGKRLNLNYDNATAYHHAALDGLLGMIEELQDEIAALKASRS